MENNQNKSNKNGGLKNLFKRDGFYVILFVCLCVVAAVAAITINNKKTSNTVTQKQTKVAKGESKDNKPDNSLFVKDEKKESQDATNKNKSNIQVYKSGKKLSVAKDKETTSVATTIDAKFAKPVEGTIAQAYSEVPVLCSNLSDENTKTYKTNFGIDIKVQIGAPVVAAADGVVEVIGEDPKGHGNMIVIDHKNGYKTVYSNLKPESSVKAGDKVSAGKEIGKVGDTTLRTMYGEDNKLINHLHFSILEGNGNFKDLDYQNKYIDPLKFVKY